MSEYEPNRESPNEKAERIVKAVFDHMNSFGDFNKEYTSIDANVLAELQSDLKGIVTTVFTDTTITDKSQAITKRLLFDLSGRRGIRQGFFDPMGRGTEYDDLVTQIGAIVTSNL